MQNLSLRNILLLIIDLPELLLREVFVLLRVLFFPADKNKKKIKSLSQNAVIIESKHKGLRVISIEVMDGFSVYHGIHSKAIKPEAIEKIRTALSKKLANNNIFVSLEPGSNRMLKVIIQNV